MAQGNLNPRELARLEEEKKNKKNRARYIAISVGLLLMIALVLFVNSGLFDDGLAALKVGDRSYTVADVNYEYQKNYLQFTQTYGDYISLFLDPSLPLSEQPCTMSSDAGTWDDYFKDVAESSLVESTAYYKAAVESGETLTDEQRAQIDDIVNNYSVYGSMYGYDVNAYIAATFGAGNNEKTLRRHLEQELVVQSYLDKIYNGFSFTDEEKDAYYAEHADTYDKVEYLYAYVTAEEGKDAAEEVKAILNGMDGDDEAAFRASVLAATESEATENSVSIAGFLSQFDGSITAETITQGAKFTHDTDNGSYAVYILGKDDNHYHTVSVQHILIKAVDADGDGEYSDAEKQTAYDAVKALQDEWLAGEATKESFAALASERSEDEGSKDNGGLYEGIYKGQMVPEFNDFCFGERKPGDYAIVYGESASYTGYHLVYFVGEDADVYSRTLADDELRTNAYNDALNALTEGLSAERTFMWRYVMKS